MTFKGRKDQYLGPSSDSENQKIKTTTATSKNTPKTTVISPDFLVWKFCGKAQFPHSFGQIARNYAEIVPFRKISTPGEITVFFAVTHSFSLPIAIAFKYHHYECFASRWTHLNLKGEPDNNLGKMFVCFSDATSIKI